MRVLDWGKKRRSFEVVAFDATGQTLAAGGHDQPTVVWDVAGGAERFRSEGAAYSLQFHPLDGRLFASTQEGGLRAYDLSHDTPTETAIPGTYRGVTPPAFAPNEDWAVQLLNRHWDEGRPSTLAAVTRLGWPDQATLWEIGFGDAGESGHAFHLFCLPGGERFLTAERVFAGPHGQLDRFAVRSRADGRLLDSLPIRWFHSEVRVFGSPWNEAFILLERRRLQIYRADDLSAPPHTIQNDKRRDFTGAAFHPSGRYLAATSTDATVKLYDTSTWRVVRTFTWDVGKMRSAAFSPDGALAAAGSDTGKVVVWDVDL
jgi:WD40 repeat protein